MKQNDLISKYDVPGPRYTSYPTVPYWSITGWEQDEWFKTVNKGLELSPGKEISLYIHLPYCDSLCTFCGCHKYITTNHQVESPYIDALLWEWKTTLQHLKYKPVVAALHLGGGTPTFFSSESLSKLINGLKELVDFTSDAEMGFEGHPNSTTEEHLQTLYNFGFKRVSFGIQDYDPIVQTTIHRVQSFETVQNVHNLSRKIGYTSVSHDLVYGLPMQTWDGFNKTIEKTLSLQPDRISLYSYAHVPWIKGTGQRGYSEEDLPSGLTKRTIYENAKEALINGGYIEIGMDHFALPHDELAIAFQEKRLFRNFMGYTIQPTKILLGIGVSSISDSWFGFMQNKSNVKEYLETIVQGELPITRGHLLSEIDLEVRQHILNIMCYFETEINEDSHLSFSDLIRDLYPLIVDGLVEVKDTKISVTPEGLPFIRNCCMAFDQYLKNPISAKTFSRTI
ncbi:MAG: oxygen-independent coproporphyrinogen III oxidase [Fluviicola sp.]|jgi:oxygen-independent coproporphyrinogen-3 oxidase